MKSAEAALRWRTPLTVSHNDPVMMGMAIAALARRDVVELVIRPMDPVVFFEKRYDKSGECRVVTPPRQLKLTAGMGQALD